MLLLYETDCLLQMVGSRCRHWVNWRHGASHHIYHLNWWSMSTLQCLNSCSYG